MPLSVSELSQVSAELVEQRRAAFVQLLAERHPDIELNDGVLADLVSYLHGVGAAVVQTDVDRVLASRSLEAIAADPTLADVEIVDAVLSNYLVSRRQGTPAVGPIAIVVTGSATRTLTSGFRFTADGAEFVTRRAYVAKSGVLTGTNDVPMTLQADGTYVFTVEVQATVSGAVGNLRRLQAVTPGVALSGFVRAYAAQDFAGGLDTETTSALISRLPAAVASRAPANRYNIAAQVRADSRFSGAVGLSVIGHGNPEMLRSSHGVVPFAGGGRVDLYSRLTALPAAVTLTKTATYQGRSGGAQIWQFTIDRDEAPGFYEVTQIVRVTEDPGASSGYGVVTDVRGFDLSGDLDVVPDIATADEAAYSRYQTAVIRFRDDEFTSPTLTANVTTADYLVTVSAVPQLADLQAYFDDREVTHLCGDLLVKAPVPCRLYVSCDIRRTDAADTPDVDAIRQALAARVNAVGFAGEISAATLADTVGELLTDGQTVGEITMVATIRRPDGVRVTLQSRGVLTVPDDPERMTTGRTVAIYLDPQDISVNSVTVAIGGQL